MNRHPKQLQAKANRLHVEQVGEATYKVMSTSGNVYVVTIDDFFTTCQCEWHEWHRDHLCTHQIAALRTHLKAKRLAVWANAEDAKRQHKKTYDTGNGLWLTKS